MKKRNRNKKRSILSVILSLTLAMSLMTATAFATEENPEAADADQAADIKIETLAEAYTFDEAGTEDPTGTDQTADGTTEAAEETYITEEAGTEGSDTEYAVSDVPEELTETPENGDADPEETGDDSLYEEEYGPEALSAEELENEEDAADEEEEEEEDPEIQVFASTEGDQTLKVGQKAEGTIGNDVSFTYHLYQITEAAETITKMGDITGSEPGASLEYVIVKTDTGEEVSTETTDGSGAFAIHVGETAEFTLEAETSWYVTQDTPEAYPLLSVKSDGEYAGVVDNNGVVYYGQIEPVITGLTVTSDMEEEDNTKTYDGEKITLTAEVSYVLDGATVSYQWYKDGVEISGATRSIIVLDDNVADSGTYKCVVTVANDDRTASAEAEITITINKAAQDISYGQSTVTKIDYDDPFIIDLTETKVVGQITYASSDESVATVDPDTGEVTIVGPGYATITATAAETDNYKEATASYVLTVNEDVVEWEIDVNNDRVTWDEEHEEWVDDLTYTGEPLELEMAITLTEEEQEELVGITYQWYRYNDGTHDFDEIEGATGETYTLAGDDVNAGDYIYMCMAVVTYKSGYEHTVYGPIEVIIEKVDQRIVFKEDSLTAVAGDTITNEIITEDSLIVGAVTYTSSDESVATVDEYGNVTIVGVGTVTITATAAETDNYNAASASYTITTSDEVSLTVTSDLEGNNTKTYDGETVTLTAEVTYKAENGTYTYQWEKQNDGGEFTEIEGETGTALTLDGNVADNGTYRCIVTVTYPNVAEPVREYSNSITITIEKADQSIVFEEESFTAVAGETVTNEMTEDSVIDGAVTYTSSDESVATVNQETGEVTIVGVGTVTITATAAETDNYNAASNSYTITTFDEVSLTLTSDMEDVDNTKTYDANTVTLTAEASSKAEGVTYSYQWYTVDVSGTETEISGETNDTLMLAGNAADSGTYGCTVAVTYPNDAESVTVSDTITITINKAAQEISYEETRIDKSVQDADLNEPFTNVLTETTVSQEAGAGITYASSDDTVATVDATTGEVTIVGVGETTITATAAGTENYEEATASYLIVVLEYNVKYAVSIYGINQDVDADGNTLGLTFGPATGASYVDSYEAHLTEEEYNDGEGICLHWMSWEEIIEQCAEDPTVFKDCLESGCTHAVNLILNETLLATDYSGQMDDGDGAGYLYNSVSSNYRMWNSEVRNTGGWPASQVRAVFNGKDDLTGDYAPYALDESNCLFSCFPSVLQDAIVAKAVKSDTVYNSQTEDNNKTTYDKLWLFSGKELYGESGSNNDAIRTYEGELYQRSTVFGITTSEYERLMNYDETGGNSYWWLRSPIHSNENSIYRVKANGDYNSTTAFNTLTGFAPGFCLK